MLVNLSLLGSWSQKMPVPFQPCWNCQWGIWCWAFCVAQPFAPQWPYPPFVTAAASYSCSVPECGISAIPGIMTREIRDSEVITSNPNLWNTKEENSIINLNSDVQPINISRGQLQDFLNTMMQAIKDLLRKLQPYRRNLKNKQPFWRQSLVNWWQSLLNWHLRLRVQDLRLREKIKG